MSKLPKRNHHEGRINQLDDFLLPRKVTNTGKNTIFIEVDWKFKDYLESFGKQSSGKNIIKPGKHLFLDHFYIIIHTDDGNPAFLNQEFNVNGKN